MSLPVSPQAAAAELLRRRKIRRNLTEFSRYKGFEPAKHHQLIIDELESFVVNPDLDVLLLHAPPGSAKSTYLSVLFPAWYLANYPQNNVLFATHSVEFAQRWGRRVRNDIASDGLILGIHMSQDNAAADRWALVEGGEYYGVGAGVGISGFRADLGICDDLFGNREDAWSETVRNKRWDWFRDDFSARLKPGAKRVLMNCMVGETSVTLSDGTQKRLDEIRPGDDVLAWDSGTVVKRRVLNWAEQGEDEIIEIKTGSSTVRANRRHPFLVSRKDHPEWVMAGDLIKGDKLVTLANVESGGSRLNEKAAWLLGYMFGDGWVTVRNTVQRGYKGRTYPRRGFVTCVAHAVHDEENETVAGLFEHVVGVRPRPTPYGYSRTDVAAVGRWFRDHGLTGNAKTKRLPNWLFSECQENRLAFLAGYNSADGHIHPSGPNKGRWTQHSVSRGLIEDVRQLARSVGYRVTNISSRVNRAQPPNSPEIVESTISNVQWGPCRETAAFINRAITSIKPAGRAVVYDIEVEGAGCFIADGVVSHNTRWHEEDVAGRVIEQIERGIIRGKIITIPAIADANDPLGRKPGEYLWDEPTGYNYGAYLRERRKETSPMMWAALYQQRPAPEEGDYFKADWLHLYNEVPDVKTLRVYGASDYAVTSGGGDYTAHIVVGVDPAGRMYVLDLWRKQASSDKWIEALCDFVKQWKPIEWGEETGQIKSGVGPFLERRMRERGSFVFRRGFASKHDKSIRAQAIRGRMALQGLYLPAQAEWLADFRSELLSFPAGKHDDQVDALSLVGQLLDHIQPGSFPVEKKQQPTELIYEARADGRIVANMSPRQVVEMKMRKHKLDDR